MDLKDRPNHAEYIAILRSLSPEERLMKAFELSEMTREVFRQGLRSRFPDLGEGEFQQLYLERLALCHNRNY